MDGISTGSEAAARDCDFAWPSPPLPLRFQFGIWLRIGLQSFGGGQATQLLVYRTFVEQRRWLSPDGFAAAWGLSQIPPGINLLALAVLIGWRIDRIPGVAMSLTGLLVPSVAVTVALTAVFLRVHSYQVTALGLRGVTAGVGGIAVVMAYRLLRAPLRASLAEGRASAVASVLVLAAASATFLIAGAPVAFVLGGSGIALVALGWARRSVLRQG